MTPARIDSAEHDAIGEQSMISVAAYYEMYILFHNVATKF